MCRILLSGSNMNPISLTQRRKIYPTHSEPGVTFGWEMVFNCRGIPILEPVSRRMYCCVAVCRWSLMSCLTRRQCFSNGQRSKLPDAQLHGVAHRLAAHFLLV